MIELVYDNHSKEYVVYDKNSEDVVFVGEFQEASNEYMLALFGVEKVGSDGRS